MISKLSTSLYMCTDYCRQLVEWKINVRSYARSRFSAYVQISNTWNLGSIESVIRNVDILQWVAIYREGDGRLAIEDSIISKGPSR